MKKSMLRSLMFLVMSSFVLCSCSSAAKKDLNEVSIPVEGYSISPAKYSDKNNWLQLPSKPEKTADVFYIYPTMWAATKDGYPLPDLNNSMMREGAKNVYEVQATAFETAGNVYAPYYRQLDAEFLLSMDSSEQSKHLKGVPGADITAAFDYYIKNYNKGRPFILVGHSQGASLVKVLLYGYLKDNPEILKRMVAAYVIGYYVTQEELDANPHVKFAEGPNDIGVIISYNTEGPEPVVREFTLDEKVLAINPILWTRGETLAPASISLGSRLLRDGKFEKVMDFADAKVDTARGIIICSAVNPEDYAIEENLRRFFPVGTYHSYDIPFYYYNLRENAENRVKHYFEGLTKEK